MESEPNIVRGLADAVREALAAASIPQRAAAERAGIPVATLHRRLNTSSPFRADELAALAAVAGTTVSALAERAEGGSPATTSRTADGTPTPQVTGATDGYVSSEGMSA